MKQQAGNRKSAFPGNPNHNPNPNPFPGLLTTNRLTDFFRFRCVRSRVKPPERESGFPLYVSEIIPTTKDTLTLSLPIICSSLLFNNNGVTSTIWAFQW